MIGMSAGSQFCEKGESMTPKIQWCRRSYFGKLMRLVPESKIECKQEIIKRYANVTLTQTWSNTYHLEVDEAWQVCRTQKYN
jgi:hypothetical protein